MMIDIDKFKSVNDRFGHANGDTILRHVARTMAGVTRKADLLARYGGEEFCVVMARTTYAGVTAAAERLRRAVEEHPAVIDSGEEVRITISVGAAAMADVEEADAGKQLLQVADAALYRAKAQRPQSRRSRAAARDRSRSRSRSCRLGASRRGRAFV